MTALERIIQWIRTHKTLSTIITVLTSFIFLTPLCLYFVNFHHALSSDPNKWSAFGSYIGGVYGPLATIISVVVLVITVIEINQSNRINITESKNNNHI
ncbi:TPA: hypothetical protein ACNOHR_002066, partial [Enterobacter hormaechei]